MPKFLILFMFLAMSLLIFYGSSELALRMEHTRHFNYANTTYVFAVTSAFTSVTIASLLLLEMRKMATEQHAKN